MPRGGMTMQVFSAMSLPLTVLAAVLLDRCFGEPQRFHPLAGFGNLAQWLEKRVYRATRLSGVLAVCIVLIPLVFLAYLAQRAGGFGTLFSIVVLYFAIAPRSLAEHAGRVAAAFSAGDLPAARQAVSRMVSRDTSQLNENGVAKATVESVLENGNDAIFAALFWFVVAGLPGVVLYRLSNTLDAMWGYRNARYNEFGWAAAKLDDALNFIPARLTALSYTLFCSSPDKPIRGFPTKHSRVRSLFGVKGWLGGVSGLRSAAAVSQVKVETPSNSPLSGGEPSQHCSALHCWRSQASLWDSPNAGPVMAAGAGALQVQLGGAASYHGVNEVRPLLGCGAEVAACDIPRAVALVQRVLWVWVTLIFVVSGMWEVAHA